VYLAANSLAPAYKGIELGIGEGTLLKALSEATGRTLQQVKSHVEATGDLGMLKGRPQF
jgi:DNA ligase-1